MGYGSPEWEPWVLGQEECNEHVKFAFDRMQVYSNGLGEVIRGAVGKTPDVAAWDLYLSDSAYNYAGPDNVGYVNQHGLSRKHIFAAVKDCCSWTTLMCSNVCSSFSLPCHRVDKDTPISETMEALHDVVKAGLVRYIGMSSCYAWECINQYSLLYREEEREMMPTLKHFGVGSIPWSPLARGALTRPHTKTERTVRQEKDEAAGGLQFALGSGNKAVIERVDELAKKYNATMAQISIAWVMSKDGALDITLSEEDIKYLEEPYKPMAIFSH
ncbi:Aldo/keto reductase [Mycena polygramma]|nr:Aldo/keto reductase [Mycena polygramma]